MDDHEEESREHPTEPLHSISSAERRDREIIKSERTILVRLGQAVKLADFMAILMVLATFFSAYATWRTALVTSTIFAVADRPFLGVQQVTFERTDAQHPTIAVNFRNFGSIQAMDAIVGAHGWSMARWSNILQTRCPRRKREFCRRTCRICFKSPSRPTLTRRLRTANPTCKSR